MRLQTPAVLFLLLALALVSSIASAQSLPFRIVEFDSTLEGVIAKRKGSIYQPGRRSGAWLKYKPISLVPFVEIGWVPKVKLNSCLSAGDQAPIERQRFAG